ncbi:maleylpyruvate isomerase family mycothiol-dependent enzyme [Streptomyces sp. NEAU-Y11]|uniref:maleylpyruvate isomerase family mycothiol-dependent enzyme n=1 Tax=Streptomyces cucumeris TaxID=2962890 RepID=UPI0020C930D8|nr:maleylpyruvate isomerase family mycothiol-dependent enzyme [Streptomyces sp. NEAU-Y11]MCP9210289.1 maleylpyruvate isomerase family mycothiol-dependent enzyme [Streptomyces sp. NEAU-Y11]
MDFTAQFHREITAFEAAARRTADGRDAPLVPSCPGWSMSDLVFHLGAVHRYVAHTVRERLTEAPDTSDLSLFQPPEDREGWPSPEGGPHLGPVPVSLLDWFAEGAAALDSLFRTVDPDEPAWTLSTEQTAGFWLRIQTIEAALHRWDAERAASLPPRPMDAALAVDAIPHTFEVMAPARRRWKQAPPGAGERFRFRRADGPEVWSVRFAGPDVRLTAYSASGAPEEPCDVELTGTASELMLFLWQRLPADRLTSVQGDRAVLDRYFTLVPPV